MTSSRAARISSAVDLETATAAARESRAPARPGRGDRRARTRQQALAHDCGAACARRQRGDALQSSCVAAEPREQRAAQRLPLAPSAAPAMRRLQLLDARERELRGAGIREARVMLERIGTPGRERQATAAYSRHRQTAAHARASCYTGALTVIRQPRRGQQKRRPRRLSRYRQCQLSGVASAAVARFDRRQHVVARTSSFSLMRAALPERWRR